MILSIIIPTLNEEEYLPLLLASIKKQSFTDYEIIVADAGSKDKTKEIAASYNCKVVSGGLPAKGRNEGAKTAKGNLFLFLDSDVELPHSEFIKNSVDYFKKKKLDAAVFPLSVISGQKIDKIAVQMWNNWIFLTQKVFPHGASVFLVKNQAHKSVNGFDESVVFAEDQDYVDRMGKKFKLGFINEPVNVSLRRFEKDGRFKTYCKFFMADMHIFFKGPIKSEIFTYKFSHYKDKD